MHIRERTGEGDESEQTVGVEIAVPCGSYESFWILLQIHIEGLPAAAYHGPVHIFKYPS